MAITATHVLGRPGHDWEQMLYAALRNGTFLPAIASNTEISLAVGTFEIVFSGSLLDTTAPAALASGGTISVLKLLDNGAEVARFVDLGLSSDQINAWIAAVSAYAGTTAAETYLSARFKSDVIYPLLDTAATGVAAQGSDGADRLYGTGKADTFYGGAGDDTFQTRGTTGVADTVDGEGGRNTLDLAAGAPAGGLKIDTVAGTVRNAANALIVTFANISAFILSEGSDSFTGKAAAEDIIGRNGADTLNGDGGLDRLEGGLGNDTYVLGGESDTVVEAAGAAGGTADTITSTIGRSLATYGGIENLTLLGTGGISGTGNGLANIITGNDGGNLLDGGGATDTLKGGKGNDIYVLGAGGDVVSEIAGQGSDTITSTVTRSLAALPHVENLTLLGTGNFDATGNAANNILIGNDGKNILAGGAGRDLLTGGLQSDTFRFAKGGSGQAATSCDVITDYAKGIDRIDFASNLSKGGNAGPAKANEAAINLTTGVATFATNSGAALSDCLNDIATRFTVATNTAGEFAFFKVNKAGAYYLFISDGIAGVGASDVLVQLTGVTAISQVSLAGGDLTILA